ncbi:hypothetical protein [Serratia fonticola]|uniref:hypothetical protein n=1 Tax=Serratia fonticola TaxID=47917 RepID=UPI0015C63D74|nr:hypothetical protein [Serratia fonticola]NYA45766.1 hypothetical protein [Serratia fonticola]CAI1688628.1 Uncharacterised protein [Serratia fonticola]CAI1872459.1 Uncharacterised protein [Serratia fonticola]
MQSKLPETITMDVFILARRHPWEDEYTVTFGDSDFSEHIKEYTLLGKESITLNVPQIDMAQAEIAKLRKRRERILAEVEIQKQAIDDQIQSLLCIEQK